jgi:urea carboxylase
MFDKVLIANRGAIACRIARTLRRMGVGCVAVYSDADRHSPHVTAADEAIHIGPSPPAESYLRQDKLIAVALSVGAGAVHPGYGFLSENADFATACQTAGLAFIGPTPQQIRDFGLKHRARVLAAEQGLPLLPGSGLLTDVDHGVAEAERIGFPLMLKSTAGGGGIGMKLCADREELVSAYASVERLARGHFSDGGLFLEKYIPRARHIEVQIFGDGAGRVIALGERDCSMQRRNQKVIEEAPAPGLSANLRARLSDAAVRLGLAVGYQSAGTVEFVYDVAASEFYFLEVNTRLQVEHGVTEEVTGVDLVEWMIRVAAGEPPDLARFEYSPRGHSIQVRLYAEDPSRNFRPSSGPLSSVTLPADVRVDTWIETGTEVSAFYDPLLAKIIVHGETRDAALARMQTALSNTSVHGVETNLAYVRSVIATPVFRAGEQFTRFLASFAFPACSIEVLRAGTLATVQDDPGRLGYWNVGVPPSGPMDGLAFRLANEIVGNDPGMAGLELTGKGPTLQYGVDSVIALTGARMTADLDGAPVPFWEPVLVRAGGVLNIGSIQGPGARTYLAVKGGIDVPLYLGSRATFTLGQFGGHVGRALRKGDVLRLFRSTSDFAGCSPPSKSSIPIYGSGPHGAQQVIEVGPGPHGTQQVIEVGPGPHGTQQVIEVGPGPHGTQQVIEVGPGPHGTQQVIEVNPGPRGANRIAGANPGPRGTHWDIEVTYGPHGAPDFFTDDDIATFFATHWEVHYNSSRTGIRLIGPKPQWARADGGEAGLHPSNIHDNAYAIGAIDYTGDMPVILGPDGPSLGGFVCPAVIVRSDLWKIGQLRPGDTIRFRRADPHAPPILFRTAGTGTTTDVCYRHCGEDYLLVEYGEPVLDLELRFRVQALMDSLERLNVPGVIDLTPGIRSLQVHYDSRVLPQAALLELLRATEQRLPAIDELEVPSRIVHLPLSWDDPATRVAIERYMQSVRQDAPWCPSNIEFIRRMNGLASADDVRRIVFDAHYLVMGLGDVYLGAPVATPLDPRHRLVTTKYNPARTWTPENAVGIGGAYLCVYGMEGPGGYQFVGRTIQMWNRYRRTEDFRDGKQWLLRFFDQIRFYPVSADELLRMREDFPYGRLRLEVHETTLRLRDYRRFLEENAASIAQFKSIQQAAFEAERERWSGAETMATDELSRGATGAGDGAVRAGAATGYAAAGSGRGSAERRTSPELGDVPEGCIAVSSPVTGSVWQLSASAGARVNMGDELMIVEAMKMEIPIVADEAGEIVEVRCERGRTVAAGETLLVLKPC